MEKLTKAQVESARSLAAKLGMRMSDLADAEPWTAKEVEGYAARHGKRDLLGYPHLPDIQIASAVRMLMRDDLDHEAVVCAARDRICALHVEKQALAKALAAICSEFAQNHPLITAGRVLLQHDGEVTVDEQ